MVDGAVDQEEGDVGGAGLGEGEDGVEVLEHDDGFGLFRDWGVPLRFCSTRS